MFSLIFYVIVCLKINTFYGFLRNIFGGFLEHLLTSLKRKLLLYIVVSDDNSNHRFSNLNEE
jgi:hypothetical protein